MPVKTRSKSPKFIVNRPDPRALDRLLIVEDLSLAAVVIRLAWQLGLLRSEIHELTWAQVDFTASEVRLPERSVPMEPEVQVFLQRLSTLRGGAAGLVVLSDRGGTQPTEQHLSYVCRKALDRVGQTSVRLLDLRYDYIIRLLEKRDWQYVSRVTGLDPRTLQLHFSLGRRTRPVQAEKRAGIDAERLRVIIEAEGLSACGAALRLVWELGLSLDELTTLRWDQLDLDNGTAHLPPRDRTIPAPLLSYLRELRALGEPFSDHVLISDRARTPMTVPYISKLTRNALVRGGCDDLTLRDLRRDCELRERCEAPVLDFLRTHSRVMRADVMTLLSVSEAQADARLRGMVERGTLVHVGHCYYLPGVVVAPDQQRDVVLAYLSTHPGAQRKQLARLLGLDAKPCLRVLEKLQYDGDLRRDGSRYYLAE